MICKKINREDWGKDLQWYAYTRFYFTTEYGWNYIPLDLLTYFPLLIANTVILFLVILFLLVPLIVNTALLGCPLTVITALKYDSISAFCFWPIHLIISLIIILPIGLALVLFLLFILIVIAIPNTLLLGLPCLLIHYLVVANRK